MSEWLDLMLEEVHRKKQELKEAEEEHARRASEKDKPQKQEKDQE
jgi:hypothetical protein